MFLFSTESTLVAIIIPRVINVDAFCRRNSISENSTCRHGERYFFSAASHRSNILETKTGQILSDKLILGEIFHSGSWQIVRMIRSSLLCSYVNDLWRDKHASSLLALVDAGA